MYKFNSDKNPPGGIILEQGRSESSGFYADGDFAAIWSPGDKNRLLRVYDTDGMKEKWYIDASGYAHTLSDQNSKENIEPLGNCLLNLQKINSVKYNYKKDGNAPKTKSQIREVLMSGPLGMPDPDSSIIDGPIDENKYDASISDYYGFVAQEVAKVFPNMVSSNENGELYISYIEFIPVLVECIKELNKEVEELKDNLSQKPSKNTLKETYPSFPGTIELENPGILYQNIPNPFNERTVIKYYLSERVNDAKLYVYDLNGKQLFRENIFSRGTSEHIIEAGRLGAGLYIYSMVADGQLIGSKQMVIID